MLRDLVNSDTFFLEDSEVFESSDYFAFIRSSSIPDDHYNPELEVSAKINSSGQLVVNGTVGKSFEAIASYISSYDSQNYYPNQLDEVLRQKASSMFPNVSFDDLDEKSKDLVWAEVKSSKITWDLSLSSTFWSFGHQLNTELPISWARLQAYQLGDVVEFDGKLWESKTV